MMMQEQCTTEPQLIKDEDCVYKIRMSDYRQVLTSMLDVLHLALPNKQQHSAAVRTVREAVDKGYFRMLSETHPDCAYGHGPEYAVEPL